MKTKKNWIAAMILTILLLSLATPLIALQVSASEDNDTNDDDDDHIRIMSERENWYKLETPIVTVLFPRGGTKPIFIWWHTDKPEQIYVVKYQGLIEYFAFDHPLLPPKPEYYRRVREAWQENWRERFENMYFKPEENRWMGMGDLMRRMLLLQIMYQMMEEMELKWHRPFLPFDAARWTLSDIANITTSEGKIIGVSFAFTLTELSDWMPNLQFVENNIMIRVRFYNETVEEIDQDTGFKYEVKAGEMKMDLVVNKWVWNIDTIKQLLQELRDEGFNITIPEAKSRLALWVNLASINMTRLDLAEDKPEEIEDYSETSHMDIEDRREDATVNKTEVGDDDLIEDPRPVIKLEFANETTTLGGFFRFVSSAKVKGYPNAGDAYMVPVKAAYLPAGNHMKLFIGYPYFGNGTLEHDPSIGVDVPSVDTAPKYSVQAPSGSEITPIVLGKYVQPLFTTELMIAVIAVISTVAVILYVAKWKRKTPINMVGAGTTG